jgi:type IV secretory pathway TrbD component
MRQYALITLWISLFGLAIWTVASIKANVQEAQAARDNVNMQSILK